MSKGRKRKGDRPKQKKSSAFSKGFTKSVNSNSFNLYQTDVAIQQGIQYYQSGQYEKAQQIFQEAIKEQKNNAEALYLFSAASSQLGQYDIAVKSVRKAIELQPDEPKYYFQLGNIFQDQSLFEQAVESFKTVIKINPDFSDVYYNLGNAHLLNKNFREAIAAYRKNLKITPQHYDSLNNLGHAFLAVEAYKDAENTFKETIKLRPKDYSGYNHLGTVFQQQEKYEQALQYFRQAIAIDPTNPNIKYNLGNALQEQGNISEAISIYQGVLEKQPDNIQAKFNLGWSLLLTGKLPQGWEGYENRFKASDSLPPLIDSPFYSGAIEQGKTLFIWSEQGLGDSLQFIRYAVFLQQQSIDITVGVNPLLKRLFENCLGLQLKIVNQNEVELSQYKDHIPLLSLPYLLQTNEKTIPLDIPYICLPSKISKENNLSEKLKEFNVGIVWGSSLTNPKMYKNKSITLSDFLNAQIHLKNSKEIALFSLQAGEDAPQILPFLDEWSNLYDLSPILNDFCDTASIIEQLDLVITVDTAVAHLAGAMGKPVWVMLPFVPDWRWQLERKDTPWYPTMVLFRQHQRGDWDSVFRDIKQALTSLLHVDSGSYFITKQSSQLDSEKDAIFQNLCNRGKRLLVEEQTSEAIAIYEEAIILQPENAEVLNIVADLYQNAKHFDKAIELFKKAIKISPQNAGFHFNLGNAFLLEANYPEAEFAYCKAVNLEPNNTDFLNNLGYSLQQQSKYNKALQIFKKIVDLRPEDSDVYNHLGNIYQDLKDYPQAIKYFQQALKRKKNNLGYQYNLGNAYQLNKEHKKAAIAYKKILEIDPNHLGAQYNLGNAFLDLRQLDNATLAYKKAIKLKPDYAEAHVNLSLVLLVTGKLKEGWQEYEWRFHTQQAVPLTLAQKIWDGTSKLKRNELYLWSEQGFGDSIQFIRYVNLLKAQDINIKLVTVKPLIRLFRKCLTEKIEIIENTKIDLTQVQNHASLMSLPYILGTQEETIPCNSSYIKINDKNLSLMLPECQGKKIGIVWASGIANQGMYANKSIKLELFINTFQELLDASLVTLFGLQVGEDAYQILPWTSHENIYDMSPLISDFYDTANIVEQLDLVISVDTAIAHLAGAMGKDTWILLPAMPDWRWQLDRQDTPWYSSMRLFRQPQDNDWESVIHEVKSNLLKMINKNELFPIYIETSNYDAISNRQKQKQTMKPKTCLHIISYFEGSLGYNVHARELSNALEKIINSQNIDLLRTNISDLDNSGKTNEIIHSLKRKAQEFNIFNICLTVGKDSWSILKHFPGVKIAYTVWESTKLPDDWLKPLKKCDYVWTASHWGKEILRKNGLFLDKIYVVPEGVDANIFHPQQTANEQLSKNQQFKFFTIGKCETRKSTTELIHAFDLEFWQEPNVVLVLACEHPFVPTFNMSAFINNLWLYDYNQFLLVSRVDSHITLAQIAAACQCGVFPTKAEGWGLPVLESMALGKPTIVTNYSAITEYADESNAIFIDHNIVPIQDFALKGFVRADEDYGTWAQPKTSDLRKKMRYVYENYKGLKQQFIDSSVQVRKEWSWEASAQKMIDVVQDILDKRAASTYE